MSKTNDRHDDQDQPTSHNEEGQLPPRSAARAGTTTKGRMGSYTTIRRRTATNERKGNSHRRKGDDLPQYVSLVLNLWWWCPLIPSHQNLIKQQSSPLRCGRTSSPLGGVGLAVCPLPRVLGSAPPRSPSGVFSLLPWNGGLPSLVGGWCPLPSLNLDWKNKSSPFLWVAACLALSSGQDNHHTKTKKSRAVSTTREARQPPRGAKATTTTAKMRKTTHHTTKGKLGRKRHHSFTLCIHSLL